MENDAGCPLTVCWITAPSIILDTQDLRDSLDALAQVHERQATVVTLRFVCGFTVKEVAELLEVSEGTVEGDYRLLGPGRAGDSMEFSTHDSRVLAKVVVLFQTAGALSPEERQAFLDRESAGDPSLRAEVASRRPRTSRRAARVSLIL